MSRRGMEGQLNIFDFLQQAKVEPEPVQQATAKAAESPCASCDVKWGSLTCFVRRGYIIVYGERGRFARNGDGTYLRTALPSRECKVTYDWEEEQEREQRIITQWVRGEITAKELGERLKEGGRGHANSQAAV